MQIVVALPGDAGDGGSCFLWGWQCFGTWWGWSYNTECPLCHGTVHSKMADFMLSLSPESSAKCWGRHTNVVLYFYDIWSQNTLKIIFSRCTSYWRKLTSKKLGHCCWWFMKWTGRNYSCCFLTSCVAGNIHHIPPSMGGWYYLQVTDAKPEVQLKNLPWVRRSVEFSSEPGPFWPSDPSVLWAGTLLCGRWFWCKCLMSKI